MYSTVIIIPVNMSFQLDVDLGRINSSVIFEVMGYHPTTISSLGLKLFIEMRHIAWQYIKKRLLTVGENP